MNYLLSEQIYNELIKGKYLNKNRFDLKLETLVINDLYIELETNFDEYLDLYKKIGLILELQHDSFYLQRNTDNEEIDKNILKQYILMNIIFRHLHDNRIPISNFTDPKIGIPETIMDDIKENPHNYDFLVQAEIGSLQNIIGSILERKNIVFKNHKNNFVLTNIGNEFLKHLFQTGKEIVEGDEIV